MTYPAPAPLYLGPPAKRSTGSNKPIHRIVLHGTVSPTQAGGARKIAAYFRSTAAGGSAHYVVDPSEVIQTAYDSVICWHAPPNGNSLGVELCDWVAEDGGRGKPLPLSRWAGDDHSAMLLRTAKLVAQLCLAYDVPVKMVGPQGLRSGEQGICEHSDVSEAFKLSSHWDLGAFPRQRFIRMVRAEADAIRAGGVTPTKELQPTKVTMARDLLEQAYRRARARTRQAAIRRALGELPER